jgi:hypothetical protein
MLSPVEFERQQKITAEGLKKIRDYTDATPAASPSKAESWSKRGNARANNSVK